MSILDYDSYENSYESNQSEVTTILTLTPLT